LNMPMSSSASHAPENIVSIFDILQSKWDNLLIENTALQMKIRDLEEEIKHLEGQKQTAGAGASANKSSPKSFSFAPSNIPYHNDSGTASNSEINSRKVQLVDVQVVNALSVSSSRSNGSRRDSNVEEKLGSVSSGESEHLYSHQQNGEHNNNKADAVGACPDYIRENCKGNWHMEYEISVHQGPVHGISVSSSLGLVASASWDKTCKLFDVDRKVTVGELSGVHDKGLYGVQFMKTNPEVLATVSSDHTAVIWNVPNRSCLFTLEEHTDEVNGLSFHASQDILATASDDRSIILWDVAVGEKLSTLLGHRNSVYGVCFSPVSSLLASASFDWYTKLWDTRINTEVMSLELHSDDVIGVDISSSGYLLATGSDDGTAVVVDMRTWQTLSVLKDHAGEVKRVKFSPYSQALATTSADGTAKVWDTQSWNCTSTLGWHKDHCFDVAWDDEAEFLVTASHDNEWRLWVPVK